MKKRLKEIENINELVEICAQTNGEVNFVEDIPVLSKIGHMAALLRYKSWEI